MSLQLRPQHPASAKKKFKINEHVKSDINHLSKNRFTSESDLKPNHCQTTACSLLLYIPLFLAHLFTISYPVEVEKSSQSLLTPIAVNLCALSNLPHPLLFFMYWEYLSKCKNTLYPTHVGGACVPVSSHIPSNDDLHTQTSAASLIALLHLLPLMSFQRCCQHPAEEIFAVDDINCCMCTSKYCCRWWWELWLLPSLENGKYP